MKRILIPIIMLAGLVAGCSMDKSKELYETAQLEEKQNNPEHARQLYQEIIDKYPKSPLAKQAESRLAAIGKW
jgi:TolA-binding protein